jgi:ribosomal protein S18 acetylase RimI-like enzyme
MQLGYHWERGRAARRGLVLLAHRDREEIGVCVCISLGEFSRARPAQDWIYTRWLGVAEEWRGRGLGRYLMRQALHTLHGEGYRHAAICALGENEPALALYTGLGYREVDRTYAYEKALD